MKIIKYIFTLIVLGTFSLLVLNEIYRWTWREFGQFRFENYYSEFGDMEADLKSIALNKMNLSSFISELKNKGAKCTKNDNKNTSPSTYMKEHSLSYPKYNFVCGKMLNLYRVAISIYSENDLVAGIRVKYFGEFYF